MKTLNRLPLACAVWVSAVAVLGALLFATTSAQAQPYANKMVKLIVNYPPGGAADLVGRSVAQALSERLGQQVLVENRPGANGNLGADAVAKSPSDGYTLLASSGGAVTINPFLYAKMPFDPVRDLTPVASAARVPVFLVAHPSVPVNDAKEFFTYVKANPGKLSYSSAGSGSSPHLAAEMMKRQLGLFAVHVPYRGVAPALNDLLAGQVQFMFDPGAGLRFAREGKLRLLAVGSPKRSSIVPDVPTLAEMGLSGFDADTVFGFFAPGATPPAIVSLLHDEINKSLATPKVQEAIRALGAEPMISTRQEFIDRSNADRARFGAFIKEAGITTD
jgi:tripartite-type tricarboxylate transporter receptor subunit TctC